MNTNHGREYFAGESQFTASDAAADEAYYEGEEAYANGWMREENPYNDERRRNAWDDGFMTAKGSS